MLKKNKHLPFLLGVLLLSNVLFSGCLKEGDDTIVLPLPDGKIPYSVIPANLQDSLRAHGFTINEGLEAPMIEGTYLISPMDLQFASDEYVNRFYDLTMSFVGQKPRGIIQYSEVQRIDVVGQSIQALSNIIGSDSSFTVYCYQTVTLMNGADTNYCCKIATAISGVAVENGFKDCQYAYIMLDIIKAKNDYWRSQIPAANTYRIWNDGDAFTTKISK